MKFEEAITALRDKHPKAALSPSVQTGSGFERAARVDFTKEKNGAFAGRDADGTEVVLYYNDTAKVIACTEIEPDVKPGVEADIE